MLGAAMKKVEYCLAFISRQGVIHLLSVIRWMLHDNELYMGGAVEVLKIWLT